MSDGYGYGDDYGGYGDEPRGVLDAVIGSRSGMGADIGDRLGVISQILMNLGSGRGGAGIGEGR